MASVSEHQPTTWSSYFFDLHGLVFLAPLGLYFAFKKLSDGSIFLITYALTSIYFSGGWGDARPLLCSASDCAARAHLLSACGPPLHASPDAGARQTRALRCPSGQPACMRRATRGLLPRTCAAQASWCA